MTGAHCCSAAVVFEGLDLHTLRPLTCMVYYVLAALLHCTYTNTYFYATAITTAITTNSWTPADAAVVYSRCLPTLSAVMLYSSPT
jgi:hypothetical protein